VPRLSGYPRLGTMCSPWLAGFTTDSMRKAARVLPRYSDPNPPGDCWPPPVPSPVPLRLFFFPLKLQFRIHCASQRPHVKCRSWWSSVIRCNNAPLARFRATNYNIAAKSIPPRGRTEIARSERIPCVSITANRNLTRSAAKRQLHRRSGDSTCTAWIGERASELVSRDR